MRHALLTNDFIQFQSTAKRDLFEGLVTAFPDARHRHRDTLNCYSGLVSARVRLSAAKRALGLLTRSGGLSLHQRQVRAGDDARGGCHVIALAITDREGVPELTLTCRSGRIARVVTDRISCRVARIRANARACADRTGSIVAREVAVARACADRTGSGAARLKANARACADRTGCEGARIVAIARACADRTGSVEARVVASAGACADRSGVWVAVIARCSAIARAVGNLR